MSIWAIVGLYAFVVNLLDDFVFIPRRGQCKVWNKGPVSDTINALIFCVIAAPFMLAIVTVSVLHQLKK